MFRARVTIGSSETLQGQCLIRPVSGEDHGATRDDRKIAHLDWENIAEKEADQLLEQIPSPEKICILKRRAAEIGLQRLQIAVVTFYIESAFQSGWAGKMNNLLIRQPAFPKKQQRGSISLNQSAGGFEALTSTRPNFPEIATTVLVVPKSTPIATASIPNPADPKPDTNETPVDLWICKTSS